jgi:hypothetical protein
MVEGMRLVTNDQPLNANRLFYTADYKLKKKKKRICEGNYQGCTIS